MVFSSLWLTLLFVRSSYQLLVTAKLEIFGLKYSVLGVCHMIFGQVSSNYSDSSENGIRKKYITLAMIRATYTSFQ